MRNFRSYLLPHLWPGWRLVILIALASAIYSTAFALVPGVIGRLIDAAIAGRAIEARSLPVLVLTLAAAMVLLVVLGAHVGTMAGYRTRRQLFLALDGTHSDVQVESATTRCTNDVSVLQTFLSQVVMVIGPAIGIALISIGLALAADPVLATPVLVALPLLGLLSGVILRQAIVRARPAHAALDDLSSSLHDVLEGGHLLRTIPDDKNLGSSNQRADAVRDRATSVGYMTSLLVPTAVTATGVLSAALIWLGLVRIESGNSSPGEIAQFIGYLGLISTATIWVSSASYLLPSALESARRIGDVLMLENGDPKAQLEPAPTGVVAQLVQATVEVGGAAEPILCNVDLTVSENAQVVVVGRSGAGKTTLLELLAGSKQPTSGELRLGDRVRGGQTESGGLNRLLVGTESTLTAGTVRDCVGLGRPGAADEEIIGALDCCLAGDFVRARGGLDSEVQHGAANFSGGERHRLALARAVLADPDLLLADEPFRTLDGHTAARLWPSLAARLRDQAIVLGQRHRPAGAETARMVLLENGEVIDEGRHADLQERHELYRALHRSKAER